jgi:hypothetical protein
MDGVFRLPRGHTRGVKRLTALVLGLVCGVGCNHEDPPAEEAEVGGDRTGCEEPGSHSVRLSNHSCECEPGYSWCSDALDDFDCCPIADDDTGTETSDSIEPELPCGDEQLEQMVCVPGPTAGDPTGSVIWACSGEDWVEVTDYATFACMAENYSFAYGCVPDQPTPSFACGHGQGTICDPAGYGSLCKDEDIIDTCAWGLRTIDRCSRLCAELEVFGEGYSTGACSQPDSEIPAVCDCE